MRIGVDATCWQNKRGYGRHSRSLLTSLVRIDNGNHYTLFLDSIDGLDCLPPRSEVHLLQTTAPTALAASASGRRSLGDMWTISRAMSGGDFDLLLFPTIYSYVPTFTRAKKLVMIHDVIAETYPRLTTPTLLARFLWRTKVVLGRLQADALITVSEYSRQAILNHFKIAPGRVFVVGEASDPVFRVLEAPEASATLRSAGIDPQRRMIVYVGGFGPHKNLETLVSAFAQIAHEGRFSDVLLVMVGEYQKEVFHTSWATISRQVDELGIGDRVIFTGYLADEDLVILLNLATVLALTSLMEGFGLPAVEAAACGCPVVATKASPLPELLGDGGIFIEPRVPELRSALQTILESEDLRRQMRQAAMQAARSLTWDMAARQMVAVMRAITQ